MHPDDIPRFAELGAVANIQPLWAAHEPQMDELTIPFLGERRASWQYPFGDLLRSGSHAGRRQRLVGQQPRPARRHPRRGQPGRAGRGPRSRCTRTTGVTLADATHRLHRGQRLREPPRRDTGRIEVGYYADLAVLDRDVFAAPADEIADAKVVATYVEGERVYSAPDRQSRPIAARSTP